MYSSTHCSLFPSLFISSSLSANLLSSFLSFQSRTFFVCPPSSSSSSLSTSSSLLFRALGRAATDRPNRESLAQKTDTLHTRTGMRNERRGEETRSRSKKYSCAATEKTGKRRNFLLLSYAYVNILKEVGQVAVLLVRLRLICLYLLDRQNITWSLSTCHTSSIDGMMLPF